MAANSINGYSTDFLPRTFAVFHGYFDGCTIDEKGHEGRGVQLPRVLFMPVLLHGTFVMMLCLDVFFGKRVLAVLVCGGVLVVAACGSCLG